MRKRLHCTSVLKVTLNLLSASPFKRALSGASCVARSIIGAEDEDFENDLDQVSPSFPS